MSSNKRTAYSESLDKLLMHEGGYVNDPIDRGGETMKGISRNSWPKAKIWEFIDQAKAEGKTSPKDIDRYFADKSWFTALVSEFYYTNFWFPFRHLHQERIKQKSFDTAVNFGVQRAVKFLQQAINALNRGSYPIASDGAIGPKTIEAFTMAMEMNEGENKMLDMLCSLQADFYKRIISRDPSQAKYIKGWMRRAEWQPE